MRIGQWNFENDIIRRNNGGVFFVYSLFVYLIEKKASFVTFKSIQVVSFELKNKFQKCKHGIFKLSLAKKVVE